jgi:CcmD family protein
MSLTKGATDEMTSAKRIKTKTIARFGRLASALVAALMAIGASAAAVAQVFQKVEGRVVDEIPAVPFVGIAYGFIWVAVLVYVLVLARGLGRVNVEIDDLRRKLDRAGGGGGGEHEAQGK